MPWARVVCNKKEVDKRKVVEIVSIKMQFAGPKGSYQKSFRELKVIRIRIIRAEEE
jgi:hypothetical protein